MSNYPDGMRESDIPGWYDTESVETCNSGEQVHLVPPSLFDSLQELSREVSSTCRWIMPLVPEDIQDLFKRLQHVLSEVTIAGESLECSFTGDVIIDRNGWDCPVCEKHYNHEEYEG
jgi:non-ribosomal peptide synthetase component F